MASTAAAPSCSGDLLEGVSKLFRVSGSPLRTRLSFYCRDSFARTLGKLNTKTGTKLTFSHRGCWGTEVFDARWAGSESFEGSAGGGDPVTAGGG